MSKFDSIYESVLLSLREDTVARKATAENTPCWPYVLELAKMLIDAEYVAYKHGTDNKTKYTTAETIATELCHPDNDTKSIIIGADDLTYLAGVKVSVKNHKNFDMNSPVAGTNFVVDVEPVDKKKFAEIKPVTYGDGVQGVDDPEEVMEKVLEYIKKVQLTSGQPEQAVTEAPKEEGEAAQPGGGESALPQGQPEATPTPGAA